jgi:hypothetical protein
LKRHKERQIIKHGKDNSNRFCRDAGRIKLAMQHKIFFRLASDSLGRITSHRKEGMKEAREKMWHAKNRNAETKSIFTRSAHTQKRKTHGQKRNPLHYMNSTCMAGDNIHTLVDSFATRTSDTRQNQPERTP